MPRPRTRCGGADVVGVLIAASPQYVPSTDAHQARITRSALFGECAPAFRVHWQTPAQSPYPAVDGNRRSLSREAGQATKEGRSPESPLPMKCPWSEGIPRSMVFPWASAERSPPLLVPSWDFGLDLPFTFYGLRRIQGLALSPIYQSYPVRRRRIRPLARFHSANGLP